MVLFFIALVDVSAGAVFTEVESVVEEVLLLSSLQDIMLIEINNIAKVLIEIFI